MHQRGLAMIIVEEKLQISFSELGDGDVCIYDNAYCLKIQELTTMSARYTAVRLADGVMLTVAKSQYVQSVNARFVIERT
jgi:predicted DNA-binding helix-hairpin-helix protein